MTEPGEVPNLEALKEAFETLVPTIGTIGKAARQAATAVASLGEAVVAAVEGEKQAVSSHPDLARLDQRLGEFYDLPGDE